MRMIRANRFARIALRIARATKIAFVGGHISLTREKIILVDAVFVVPRFELHDWCSFV